MTFDESKIRRGQPDNRGQFASKQSRAPIGSLPFAIGDFDAETISERSILDRVMGEHFGRHDPGGAGDADRAVQRMVADGTLTAGTVEAALHDGAYDGGAAGQEADRAVREAVTDEYPDFGARVRRGEFGAVEIRDFARDSLRVASMRHSDTNGASFRQVQFHHRFPSHGDPLLEILSEDMATGGDIRLDAVREATDRAGGSPTRVTDVVASVPTPEATQADVDVHMMIDATERFGLSHDELQLHPGVVFEEVRKQGFEVDETAPTWQYLPISARMIAKREGLTESVVIDDVRGLVSDVDENMEFASRAIQDRVRKPEPPTVRRATEFSRLVDVGDYEAAKAAGPAVIMDRARELVWDAEYVDFELEYTDDGACLSPRTVVGSRSQYLFDATSVIDVDEEPLARVPFVLSGNGDDVTDMPGMQSLGGDSYRLRMPSAAE